MIVNIDHASDWADKRAETRAIETLEELLDLSREFKAPLIIYTTTEGIDVTIYDGYVE